MNVKLLIISTLFAYNIHSSATTHNDTTATSHISKKLQVENTENKDTKVAPNDSIAYDRSSRTHHKHGAGLIPTQFIIQNAGNMGVISGGIGWNYGKHNQWETNLLFGLVPKHDSDKAKMTMTLKQNYIPWSIYMKKGWMLEPLSCGIYINAIFGDEFWTSQPDRYPDKYYEFLSTRLRANIFLGQRITKIVPYNKHKFIKSVTAFYEVSTCDLYIRSMVTDNDISVWDIIGLSLGVKFQL